MIISTLNVVCTLVTMIKDIQIGRGFSYAFKKKGEACVISIVLIKLD